MVFDTENFSSRTSSAGATVDNGLMWRLSSTAENELKLEEDDVTDEDLRGISFQPM